MQVRPPSVHANLSCCSLFTRVGDFDLLVAGLFVVDRDERLHQQFLEHYAHYDKAWSWVRGWPIALCTLSLGYVSIHSYSYAHAQADQSLLNDFFKGGKWNQVPHHYNMMKRYTWTRDCLFASCGVHTPCPAALAHERSMQVLPLSPRLVGGGQDQDHTLHRYGGTCA
jgi:hypothetical protein